MRHAHTGRKLRVSPDHRRALLRNLTLSLIEHEAIKTTTARAKELRWYADRVVTWAKRGDLHGRRSIVQLLGSTQTHRPGENRVRTAVDKVYTVLAPRFKDRPGGYTQIFHFATRRAGDNSEMVLMRYIPAPEEKKGGKAADKGGAKKAQKPTPKVKASASDKAEKKEKRAAAPEDKPEAKKKTTKKKD